jgi:hypothetical protein
MRRLHRVGPLFPLLRHPACPELAEGPALSEAEGTEAPTRFVVPKRRDRGNIHHHQARRHVQPPRTLRVIMICE